MSDIDFMYTLVRVPTNTVESYVTGLCNSLEKSLCEPIKNDGLTPQPRQKQRSKSLRTIEFQESVGKARSDCYRCFP